MNDTRATAKLHNEIEYFPLASLGGGVSRLPITVKILLENLVRHSGEAYVSDRDIEALVQWDGNAVAHDKERAFVPSRVLLQDFTGVPAVVDLAAMRSALQRRGGDPARIDPLVPVDLVIDHSVQVDAFGKPQSYGFNIEKEYERNHERYSLLRWAQQGFNGFRVVPPGMGIVHQVNLEYLANVVQIREINGKKIALPDTLVGTDSHTTMVNGLGVLGWGVGGIEAEACMLGQPLFLLTPVVVGVRFHNSLRPGTTATDLVLTLTEMLRKHGVVNKFVEFCGSGLSSMTVPDRATLSNMSPEYGATAAYFPVDAQTLDYMRQSGRSAELIDLVERYTKEQGLFRTDESETPIFSEMLELDLSTVEPSLAGPRRPQDRVALGKIWDSFTAVYGNGGGPNASGNDVARLLTEGGNAPEAEFMETESAVATAEAPLKSAALGSGSVVIAAITSCTNTSNPSVMMAAGLLAQKALARGLRVPDYVKTSLAPGSRVVSDYLDRAGLLQPLSDLGFALVGYGCTTCIGNSGPLPEAVAHEIEDRDLAVCAVLSGNRNFEGRIHPLVKASYLASPPLVVAFGIAGTVNVDLTREPIGQDNGGNDVMLSEIWPSAEEIQQAIQKAVGKDLFTSEYSKIFNGDEHWQTLPSPSGPMFQWDPKSTYVQDPPFFTEALNPELADIAGARVLALLGDSITTDHISPAGAIGASSPAATYLREHGVEQQDFNTYGSRRGNHEVMMRGTFANIRLRNQLAEGKEGGFTKNFDSGEIVSIYDASMHYAQAKTPLIVIAGKEYGSGSSRDWAAKGPALLGVRAVIAQSFERIHRSNLVGMGVLPLQFKPGETAESLGLTGTEKYSIAGIRGVGPAELLTVVAKDDSGNEKRFEVIARLDSATDVEYFKAGGILNLMLQQLESAVR